MNKIQNRILELFPKESESIIEIFDFHILEHYYEFLIENNELGGFFSKSDESLILDRHIIESVYHIYKIQEFLNVSRETEIADVGTGPGLPGFIFACLKERPKLALIDSQRKRLQFLEEFLCKNGVEPTSTGKKIQFIYQRAEEVLTSFDCVVSRSSVPYPWTAEVVAKLVKKNGYFIPFLARQNYDLDLEMKILKNSGFQVVQELELKELHFLGQRHIKFLKKMNKTKHSIPRKWKIIKREIEEKNGKGRFYQ